MAEYGFEDFMNIIRKLRSREGCPWDREQTHESLKTCLIEECYETVEAINNQDKENLCEELGDILLQVALHSVIAEESGQFTINQVVQAEAEKMIRRHPHVFGDVKVADSAGVVKNWEEIKTKEKKAGGIPEEIAGIPKATLFSQTSVPWLNPEIRISSSNVVGLVDDSISRTNLVPNSGTAKVPEEPHIGSSVKPSSLEVVNKLIVALSSSGIVCGS
jgi:tetrapyrrole methylase family protein/MazG family protein